MNQQIPDTICELLEWRALFSPEALACVSHAASGEASQLNWQDFQQRVVKLAAVLQDEVDRPGIVVAIRLPSCLLWELISHALMRLGCVIVGVDCQASVSDVQNVLDRCNASLLITESAQLNELQYSMPFCIKTIVLTDDSPSPFANSNLHFLLRNLRDLVEANGENQLSSARHLPTGTDLATIVFTSGTTGEPKGIPFRHEQVIAACRAVQSNYVELGSGDSTICWLPLSALFQRMLNLLCVASGMTNHFIADPRQIFTELARIQPTFLVGVPRFYEKLNDALANESNGPLLAFSQHVKYMISGSAPLSRSLLDSLYIRGLLILEAYGLSENTVPIATNRASDYRFGSVGKPLAPNQVRLAADGEVEVKGIGVFSGYFGQESSDCFTPDGFYRSGDLGTFDEDGFLFLTGRKRDLFKTSTGRRIGPSRIEAVYSGCPSIDQLVVLGDNQKYLAALVTLKPTDSMNAKDWESLASRLLTEMRSVDQCLSEHERVQAIGILDRPFHADEVTSSMKLKRDVIVRRYASFISRLYNEPTPCVLQVQSDEL